MSQVVVIVLVLATLFAGLELARARSRPAPRWVTRAWWRCNHFRPQDPSPHGGGPSAGWVRTTIDARRSPQH
ncbi:hypothetical protein D092_06740 [Rhodococcus ruber Chol-4]|uniref:hypothetical protein n=1 Tax=Rhodococcus ruber TaxID=1830 RepID=UPI00034B20E3|nr:hypothetical protein [Rhodococcus ruber]KXF87163.1 hypothetical protein D092_06740 [Rhodococcus ruber Chol-4]MDO1480263.1 hypothetical protein [Rhodococcus ruber]QDC15038.1 hypothetical protein E2561_13885 [Rhodococcus ruber]